MKKIFISILALVLFVWVIAWVIPKWWCGLKATDMGVYNKFTIVSGCLMSADQKIWVPDERFRIVGASEE